MFWFLWTPLLPPLPSTFLKRFGFGTHAQTFRAEHAQAPVPRQQRTPKVRAHSLPAVHLGTGLGWCSQGLGTSSSANPSSSSRNVPRVGAHRTTHSTPCRGLPTRVCQEEWVECLGPVKAVKKYIFFPKRFFLRVSLNALISVGFGRDLGRLCVNDIWN